MGGSRHAWRSSTALTGRLHGRALDAPGRMPWTKDLMSRSRNGWCGPWWWIRRSCGTSWQREALP
eukprot:3121379-Alexandrium_andersonii.AAC.1